MGGGARPPAETEVSVLTSPGGSWGRQNEMVRLRVGGPFLLSLCLVGLRGQSWRRLLEELRERF